MYTHNGDVDSGVAKVATGMAQAQPILSSVQPTLLLIRFLPADN